MDEIIIKFDGGNLKDHATVVNTKVWKNGDLVYSMEDIFDKDDHYSTIIKNVTEMAASKLQKAVKNG